MKTLNALLVALILLAGIALFPGCIVHPHHKPHVQHTHPVTSACPQVSPWCLANPGKYSEPMYPRILPNGRPQLVPETGLKSIVNPQADAN